MTSSSSNSPTLDLAIDLISRPSITPEDEGCQELLADRLEKLGFVIEPMPFGPVKNLWARRGDSAPLFVFAGHTDVVPTGPLDSWDSDPFQPTIRDGQLYGRGSADMKGSVAAMVTACEEFISANPNHKGSIGFLITSDEEGDAKDGTIKVIETLEARGEKIDYCLVGEPSSSDRLGDAIKNGRRGSLNGDLTIRGIQGHVAYPHLAKNPLHVFTPVLENLCAEKWDLGNEFFPPTSFQVSNVQMGTGVDNIIPGELQVTFNFRFSSELDQQQISQRFTEILDQGDFVYEVNWRLSGNPFLTPRGALVDAAQLATQAVTGMRPALSTSGGTSDGRFIAPTGAQVLELGPLNGTIHKVNECVGVDDLDQLSSIYCKMLEELLL